MGYTHYFTAVKKPTTKQWAALTKAVKQVFKDHGEFIQLESDDSKKPLANTSIIRFNGIEDEGHETFYFPKDQDGFSFCKTARKPYDEIVTACLTLANHFAPGCYDIGSDGEPNDWEVGREIAEGATSTAMEIPIS
jgi:hypothetical protein